MFYFLNLKIKYTNFVVALIFFEDGELVQLRESIEIRSLDVPESEIEGRRITRSQRKAEAAKSSSKNHDRTIDVIHDIETNSLTNILVQNDDIQENGKLTNKYLS